MSKLTDRISYLQGLAEGMKLNPDKDSHKLILGILEVLGEVGQAYEALAESHAELGEYVESMDEDLADLEAEIFGDDEDDEDDEDDGDDEDPEDSEDGEEEESEPDSTPILYECPHCHETVEIDPDSVDFDEEALCPSCGKELFPETLEE